MISRNYQGVTSLGDVGNTNTELMYAAMPFFVALYIQSPGTSKESARYNLFTKKKRTPKAMALPPTPANLLQHILWAHLKVMLWKAANCGGSPGGSRGITNFGWKF